MTEPAPRSSPSQGLYPYGGGGSSANLADILERVLDKGIVIVGDIKINLLDIELLTIKLRLLVASVDKAREIGIDWWEHDPALSSRARHRDTLEEQNESLRAEVEELRRKVERVERAGRSDRTGKVGKAESAGELTARDSGTRRRSKEAEPEPESGAQPQRARRKKDDDAEDRERDRGRGREP
ncbi:gas vesicle protein [Streptomyces sp. M41]|uniref:gas vesicle protein n=1 Tax=Streptomyces sp. M41 TaxID=3059412 RepID=UPI00374D03F7